MDKTQDAADRYVVTGGCGFIGSAVVNELLRRNCEVLILDNMSLGRDHWKDNPSRPHIPPGPDSGREQPIDPQIVPIVESGPGAGAGPGSGG